MKSSVELKWMLLRCYTHRESQSRKELLEKLRDLWGGNTSKDLPLGDLTFEALKKLYDDYQEDFMMILLMTMRQREALGKKGFLSGPGLLGLRSLLKHWEKQKNNAQELDVVCEFIGSRQELRKPEYIVGALIEQVRRIRRGWKPGKDEHLEISDGLLTLAEKSVEQISKGSGVDDYNVVPNEHLGLIVEFQKLLDQGKRPISAKNLNGELEDFKKRLDDPMVSFFAKDIYQWWTCYSLLRNSRRMLIPEEASRYDGKEEGLEGVFENMSPEKQEWAKDLRKTGSVLNGVTKEMEPLVEYHQGIAEFLNGKRKTSTRAAPRGKGDKRDLKLYSTIVGRKMRTPVNLFVNTKTMPVKEEEGGTCLINHLEKSIANADLASQSVISRGHLLAPVMLVLLATDLVVRFRWFAAPVAAAVFDENYPNRMDKSDNHKEAVRLKKELIGVLENIQSRLELVLDENLSSDPLQLIGGWKSFLKDLDLEETKKIEKPTAQGRTKEVELTALGQLSDACGEFVGWPWSHPWRRVETVERRRLHTKDPNNLELYLPQQDEPLVIISVEDEGAYANNFAYVKPVKGSPS